MTGSHPLHGDSARVIYERDGVPGIEAVMHERDRLRETVDDALVALNRWHAAEDGDEQFVMDALALLEGAAS